MDIRKIQYSRWVIARNRWTNAVGVYSIDLDPAGTEWTSFVKRPHLTSTLAFELVPMRGFFQTAAEAYDLLRARD